MSKKTFSGRNLDEALEAAIREYKKPREELNYKILEEKKSLFGLEKRVTIEILEDLASPSLKFFLNKFILNSNFNISYSIEKKDDLLIINLKGDDVGYLLKNYGEGLDALQYIIEKLLQKEGFKGEVLLDASNFRENIRQKIEKLALFLCKKVKKEGKTIQTKPLPPSLRKIVHLTATKFKGIESKSQGSGYFKRIFLSCKK